MKDISKNLASILRRNWRALLLRGIVAILFGVLAWFVPEASITIMVLLFGAFALVDGSLAVWMAIAGHKDIENWWVLLFYGLLGMAVGIMTFAASSAAALVLLIVVAAWAVAVGILEVVVAIRLRKVIEGTWLLVLAGVASIVFGVLLTARPWIGALALIWLIGTCAIVFGVGRVILAFKLRSFSKEVVA